MSHRVILGFPLATAITVGLFLLMQSLIQTEFAPEIQTIEDPQIEFLREPRIEDPNPPGRELPPKELIKTPPAPPPPDQPPKDGPGKDGTTIEFEPVPLPTATDFGQADRSAIPLVRIPPEFPERAKTGGWVLVEFDITPLGAVQNAIVVGAEPRGVFNRSALKAIQKWKYRPKLIDGEPVFQYGMQQQITYEIEGEE